MTVSEHDELPSEDEQTELTADFSEELLKEERLQELGELEELEETEYFEETDIPKEEKEEEWQGLHQDLPYDRSFASPL